MSQPDPALRVEILRALGSGRTPEAVAADLLVPVATVRALGERAGWPDPDACAAAADRLDRAIAANARARLAHGPRTDPVMALLQHGGRSPRQSTRRLTARALDLLARLSAELRDEQARHVSAAKCAASHRSTAREAGLDPRVVRVWAREAGVECSARGKVPRRVVEAYVAAHSEGAAA